MATQPAPKQATSPAPTDRHEMRSYTWSLGGSGLRQGFKCSCGWYLSENNAATAREHLMLEAAVANMNRDYTKELMTHD